MASLSRCVARRTGFCRIQPHSFKMRLTWAMRPHVQISPQTPKAWAPSSNSRGICAFCPGLRRDCPPEALALTPPSLARFSHWRTVPCVTPRASATCTEVSRCDSYRHRQGRVPPDGERTPGVTPRESRGNPSGKLCAYLQPRVQCRYASIHSHPSGGAVGSGRSRIEID